jgi:hypothetical protein
MADTEGRCITASCSFPGEDPTSISIPITGENLMKFCEIDVFISIESHVFLKTHL